VNDCFSSPRSNRRSRGLARFSEDVLDEASDVLGLPLPLWPWREPAFEVFASSSARKSIPSRNLSLPSRVIRSGAAGRRSTSFGCLPCGFFPFGVFTKMGSHFSQGYHSWVTVPSQRFSRSQGFDPPILSRPCFIPVPPMGFPFRAEFHPQSSTFFRTPLPSCGWSENLHFRVLLPASVLVIARPKSSKRQRPSWVLPP
jgi:hypothetical protein